MLATPWRDSGSADGNAQPMDGQHDGETKIDVHVAAVSQGNTDMTLKGRPRISVP